MANTHNIPHQDLQSYPSPISSTSSTLEASVFSADATSQTSETSVESAQSNSACWSSEGSWPTTCAPKDVSYSERPILAPIQINGRDATIPSELRQHPRRCSTSVHQGPPPTLVRQNDRKGHFVDSLVDSATLMVEVIWPLSIPHCNLEGPTGQGVLPLRFFIQETLRRSKTSFSTLQVALYYLILIKSCLPCQDFTMEQTVDSRSYRALQCGRRMFLAALILASKYLQDRNYSARAWSKISGLKVCEINANEMAFLKAVNWKLHVPEQLFEKWQSILLKYTSPTSPTVCSPMSAGSYLWRSLIRQLSPELDNVPWSLESATSSIPVSASSMRVQSMTTIVQPSLSPISAYPPRVLEPAPNMPPPTPQLVRMGPLPTPVLTPQTMVSNTPAVGFAGLDVGRSSMCSAMATVRTQTLNNACMDYWSSSQAAGAMQSRRPSINSLASTTSSPESMISDNSRFSRASSISSASSLTSAAACAPTPYRLARMATLRNAGMTYALPPTTPVKERKGTADGSNSTAYGYFTMEPIVAEPMSSPDMEGFHINDKDTSPTRRSSMYRTSTNSSESFTAGRKRGRSSADMTTLQNNVRTLLNAGNIIDITESPKIRVLNDGHVATSFLLDTSLAETQSKPQPTVIPRRPLLSVCNSSHKRSRGNQNEQVLARSASGTVWYDLTQS